MATRTTTVQITLPEMGESVTEGTVLEWLKAEGDPVEADEGVVEVSTDKVDAEVPAPASGVLKRILVQPDETVPTGTVLGEIEVNGDGPAATAGNGGAPDTAEQHPESAGDESAVEEATHGAAAEEEHQAARDEAEQADHPPPSDGSSELTDVAMPEMGESVSEGTVLEWLVSEGDEVSVDDGLVEISTDKVDAEVPSPIAGVIREILVKPDETVTTGTVLCRIAAGGGSAARACPAARRRAPRRRRPSRAQRSPPTRGTVT